MNPVHQRYSLVTASISIACFVAMHLGVALICFGDEKAVSVNASNFVRAETDSYFSMAVNDEAFGKLRHRRGPVPIDRQEVVRMNRDTLYSNGVFDLDASPVTIRLPESGSRYMALQILSQDHYTIDVSYAPGEFVITRDQVGTRYVYLIIRTLVDPENAEDVRQANALQDAIVVKQERLGTFAVPNWDTVSLDKVRELLLKLGAFGGQKNMFGKQDEVDPVSFLIGAAGGWGGNPPSAAIYVSVYPKESDGRVAHQLTVKDVPVDGFWSISVYNAKGFFEKNESNSYSVNNVTGKTNADGSVSIQFGGDPKGATNFLPVTAGWNYTVRLYRPRKEILGGSWKFPEATPIK